MPLPSGKGETASREGASFLWAHVGSLIEAEEGVEFGIAGVVGPLLRVQESAGLTTLFGPGGQRSQGLSRLYCDGLCTRLLHGAQIP